MISMSVLFCDSSKLWVFDTIHSKLLPVSQTSLPEESRLDRLKNGRISSVFVSSHKRYGLRLVSTRVASDGTVGLVKSSVLPERISTVFDSDESMKNVLAATREGELVVETWDGKWHATLIESKKKCIPFEACWDASKRFFAAGYVSQVGVNSNVTTLRIFKRTGKKFLLEKTLEGDGGEGEFGQLIPVDNGWCFQRGSEVIQLTNSDRAWRVKKLRWLGVFPIVGNKQVGAILQSRITYPDGQSVNFPFKGAWPIVGLPKLEPIWFSSESGSFWYGGSRISGSTTEMFILVPQMRVGQMGSLKSAQRKTAE